MLAFLESVADTIAAVFDFVGNIILGLVRMVRYVAIAMQAIPQLLAYIPGDLAVIALAFVSVAVIYMIVGREGN